MTRPRLLGALLALLVLAALLALLRDEPEGTVVVEPETTPVTAPPAEPLRRDELPALEEPGDGSFSLLQGVVRTLDGDPVPAGSVRLEPRDADHPLPVTEVAVADGRFTYPSTWTEDGLPEPERFLFVGPSGAATSEVLRVEETEDTPLVLTVGRALPWRCRVTDLAGHPIPGATVRVFTRLPYRGFETTTDQDGRAEGVCYSTDTRVGIQAIAFGYAAKRKLFDLTDPREPSLALPRLFVAAWAVRPWDASFHVQTGYLSDTRAAGGVSQEVVASIREAILDRHPLESDGALRLVVQILREEAWLDTPPKLDLLLTFEQTSSPKYVLEMVPLPEGVPEPFILPDEAYEPFETSYPLDVVFTPATVFLAEPPPEIFIPIRRPRAKYVQAVRCMRSQGRKYRAWIPRDDIRILPTWPDDDFMATDWVFARSPRFLPNQTLSVTPGTVATRTVAFDPNERCIVVEVRDPADRPVYFGAWLSPSDGKQRHAATVYDMLPRKRFVRPGLWDLWTVDYSVFARGGDISSAWRIVVEDLVWPSPVTPVGHWVIHVPPDAVALEAFDTDVR